MTKPRTTITLTALAFGALLLSGCTSPGADVQEPSPSPPATPPAAVPAGPDLDDPSSWVIGFTSVGPLDRGGRLTDERASMSAFTTKVQDACPSVTGFDRPDLPAIWITDPYGTGAIDQIIVQRWGSPETVASTSPRTAEGIGIGSTADEIAAAYPSITKTDVPYGTGYYSLPDDAGNWINFNVGESGVVDTIAVQDTAVMNEEYCG